MIIKKPYAFLIKKFRIIHIIMFFLFSYLTFKTYQIYSFFRDYVVNGYYTYYESISSHFVNYYMFLSVIFVLVASTSIYMLLKWKDKKRGFYVFTNIYYIIIFITYLILFLNLNSIGSASLNVRTIRIIRDLLFLITLPQLFFAIFSLIRGIGFNIKNFNFDEYLKELDVELKDSEEVEIIIGKDSYKIFRKIRKIIRELKYTILENKFLFLMVTCGVVLVITLSIVLKVEVYDKVYSENTSFNIGVLSMTVQNSYQSNIDYKGEIISKGKTYIILSLNIINKGTKSIGLSSDDYVLIANNEKYYPIYGKGNYFFDLGESYNREKIESKKESDVLLIFEIDQKNIQQSYTLKILEDVNVLKSEIKSKNVTVKVVPEVLEEKESKAYSLKSSILFEDSNVADTLLNINSYTISNSFNETYEYCTSSKCYTGTNVIKPTLENNSDKCILKLTLNYEPQEKSKIYKYIKTSQKFITYFGSIEYVEKGVTKKAVVSVKNNKDDNVYIEIPKDIEASSSFSLLLTIRNKVFKIVLKD